MIQPPPTPEPKKIGKWGWIGLIILVGFIVSLFTPDKTPTQPSNTTSFSGCSDVKDALGPALQAISDYGNNSTSDTFKVRALDALAEVRTVASNEGFTVLASTSRDARTALSSNTNIGPAGDSFIAAAEAAIAKCN